MSGTVGNGSRASQRLHGGFANRPVCARWKVRLCWPGSGLDRTGLVAGSALGRGLLGQGAGGRDVAVLAGRNGVGRDGVESRLHALGCCSCGFPVRLGMARLTVRPQGRRVRIGMTTAAAPGDVDRDRPPVIVTGEAVGARVSPIKTMARFFLMIERDHRADVVPTLTDMA